MVKQDLLIVCAGSGFGSSCGINYKTPCCMNNYPSSIKFIWLHKCHGILGHFTNIDDLIKRITKAPYPVPNVQKLKDTFLTENSFSYAASLITIEKVNSNV